ncbi:MAG: response regulator [Pseudomonadota bacterium]
MKHCLIVDDSSVIRKVARQIMESHGFEVSEAENGQEALERCAGAWPEAILLDWQMPVMGGHEFLSALSVNERSEKTPYIVYCTTENDPVDISQALNAGASAYLLKPFDRAALEAKFADTGLI